MIRSLYAAVSGISANQTLLNAIGNNIANTNTVGYKSESVQFSDLLNQQTAGATAAQGGNPSTNPMAVGSGVKVSTLAPNFTQGSIEQTGRPLDVAIQGSGFLIGQMNGQTFYTRAGNLSLDANGVLSTANGAAVQGWIAGPGGVVNTNAPTSNLTISQTQVLNPQATSSINVGGNLPAGSTSPVTTSITAYDSLGVAVPITLTFTPSTTPGQWTLQGTSQNPGGGTTTLWNTAQTVGFTNGQISSINGTAVNGASSIPVNNMPTGYTWANGATLSVALPAPGSQAALTDFSGQSTAAATSQNGYASGTPQSYSVGQNGTITESFSNGRTQAVGRIALASFANPTGLISTGNLMYQASVASGVPQLATPGTAGTGSLMGGSLEMSNVNMGRQLTNMIIAQNAYEANTKVVATSNTVLQALVNM